MSKNKKNITESDLEESLLNQAFDGKRDGYKNLELFRRKRVLNNMIADKFGIGEPDDDNVNNDQRLDN